jgi:hypothetical protein
MKMRTSRRKLLERGIFSLASLLIATASLAAAAAGTSIVTIEGESDKALSIVTVALAGKPDWASPSVEDHGTFVQILLPSTIVPSPGTFLDANSPYITKIAAFQVPNATTGQPTDAAVRLFVNRDAAAVKQALVSEILTDRVVVTLDHKKLDAALASAGQIANPSASDSKIETGNAPTPAELVRIESDQKIDSAPPLESSWSTVGVKVPDLSNKLAIVSGFSLFMLALLGIVYKWRRLNPFSQRARESAGNPIRFKNIIKHRVPESEDGDDFARDTVKMTMKTISSMAVGPRQKLTLVQVGNETVLLSISPTGVQFLTNVSNGANRIPSYNMTQVQGSRQIESLPEAKSKSFEERIDHDDLEEAFAAATQGLTDVQKPVPAKSPLRVSARQGATVTKKVRVAVTDQGITNLETSETSPSQAATKPSDDITRLIREKLRNLPVI